MRVTATLIPGVNRRRDVLPVCPARGFALCGVYYDPMNLVRGTYTIPTYPTPSHAILPSVFLQDACTPLLNDSKMGTSTSKIKRGVGSGNLRAEFAHRVSP